MKKSELFQNIDTLMTEVLDLKKSWDEKMDKAEEGEEPSDAMDDAVHMADHGEDEEGLSEYASKLSDEELHELISSLVQEAESRSEGEEPEAEEPEAEEEPEMEKAEDESEEMPEEEEESEGESEEMPEEEEESEEGDLESSISGLSDEEIQTLMSAIQSELAKRGSGEVAEKSDKPSIDWSRVQEDRDKPTEEEQKKHEAWIREKKESEKMEKSLRAALKKIEDLSAQVESLKKSAIKKVERGVAVPSQKYADPKITVLEKSSSDSLKQVMTGATLANWLISEQASGNKKVNSDLVTKANLAKSIEDASEFYQELERIGIKAPRS